MYFIQRLLFWETFAFISTLPFRVLCFQFALPKVFCFFRTVFVFTRTVLQKLQHLWLCLSGGYFLDMVFIGMRTAFVLTSNAFSLQQRPRVLEQMLCSFCPPSSPCGTLRLSSSSSKWASSVSVKDRLLLRTLIQDRLLLTIGVWIQATSSITRLLASAARGLLLSCPRLRSVRFDFTHRRHPTTAKMKDWSECLCEGLHVSMDYFISYIFTCISYNAFCFGRLSLSLVRYLLESAMLSVRVAQSVLFFRTCRSNGSALTVP